MPDLNQLLANLTSGNEERAEAALPLLHELDRETVIPALRALLDSPEIDTRWWAARALASFPEVEADLLLPLLDDPAPEVRQCAALGLCSHPSERSIPALICALSDPDSLVADLAARALIAIGRPAADALIAVLKEGSQSAKIHAMHALAKIADPRAIQPMIEALSNDSAMLQYWAEIGLENMGVNMVYLKPQL